MDAANRLQSAKRGPLNACAGGRDHRTPARTASCGIAIMAKASAPGRTKTRLVPPLTFEQAAALNTAFLQDIAGNLYLAGSHAGDRRLRRFRAGRLRGVFPRHPAASHRLDRCVPAESRRLPAAARSRKYLRAGTPSAVVLNSDSPTLPTALLVEAASMLAQPGERAVLGPSTDGGYYLLGLKTVHRRLFEDIAWSTERVAAQTLERAREIEARRAHAAGLVRCRRRGGLAPAAAASWATARRRQAKLDPRAPHYPAATAALLRSLAAGAVNAAAETDECSSSKSHSRSDLMDAWRRRNRTVDPRRYFEGRAHRQ